MPKAGHCPMTCPGVKVVRDIDDRDKICGCGCELTRIGAEQPCGSMCNQAGTLVRTCA